MVLNYIALFAAKGNNFYVCCKPLQTLEVLMRDLPPEYVSDVEAEALPSYCLILIVVA